MATRTRKRKAGGGLVVAGIVAAAVLIAAGRRNGNGNGTDTLAVVPAEVDVTQGMQVQLRAIRTFPDGSTSDVTSSATWTSPNPLIASVVGGLVTGISQGSVDVRATVPL